MEYESNPELAVKQWIKRRLAYHRRVQEYFSCRDSDLLIVNICDGHDQQQLLMDIAGFLDLKVSPGMVFPRANESKRRRQRENTSVRKKSDVRAEVMDVMNDIGLERQYQNIDFP